MQFRSVHVTLQISHQKENPRLCPSLRKVDILLKSSSLKLTAKYAYCGAAQDQTKSRAGLIQLYKRIPSGRRYADLPVCQAGNAPAHIL